MTKCFAAKHPLKHLAHGRFRLCLCANVTLPLPVLSKEL